jgi:outer membrane protein
MRSFVLLGFGILCFPWNVHSQSPQGKIGYANLDYIFNKLPEAKQIETELKSLQGQLESQLKNKYEDFRKKYEAYDAKTLTMAELQKNRKELQLMQENLDRFEQECQSTFQRKQKQLMDPVIQSIQKAISSVANESNYDFILNAGAGQNDVVLFAVEQADVSDLVLQKLGVQATTVSPR